MPDLFLSRRVFIHGACLTTLAMLTGCTTATILEPIEPGYADDRTMGSLPIVNTLRAKHGLGPVFHDLVAANAAKDQAIRMARVGKMSHFLGSDASFLDRMKRLTVRLPAAENIAVGQSSTDLAVDAWIRSKKHLDNLLGPFTGMGVAVAYQASRNNRPYWSMILSSLDKPVNVDKPAAADELVLKRRT